MSTGEPVRRRRSTTEVRTRILDAARELFLEQGYGVSTREIARRADVVEPLVYRQFGTKAALLEQALVAPLSEFAEAFLDRWRRTKEATTLRERTHEWVETVFDLMQTNRALLLAVLAGHDPESGQQAGSGLAEPLAPLFAELAKMTRVDFAARGTHIDADLGVRLMFSLIAGVVLMENWLFTPSYPRPGRAEMISALTDYILTPRSAAQRSPRQT